MYEKRAFTGLHQLIALDLRMTTRICRSAQMFLNPLSQVGVRIYAFEVPVEGQVSRINIRTPVKQPLVQNNAERYAHRRM